MSKNKQNDLDTVISRDYYCVTNCHSIKNQSRTLYAFRMCETIRTIQNNLTIVFELMLNRIGMRVKVRVYIQS